MGIWHIKLCKLAFRARESEWHCTLQSSSATGTETSLKLKEGMWGSDLPLEPGHLQLVWFVKLGREILGDGHLQHLIHIWGLKNRVSFVFLNSPITLIHFSLILFIIILFIIEAI